LNAATMIWPIAPRAATPAAHAAIFRGPCRSLRYIELFPRKRRRMVHLALGELLFECLAGGLSHAGIVEHLDLEVAAILFLSLGILTIPPKEFVFCCGE
jgi:hypothetical protein